MRHIVLSAGLLATLTFGACASPQRIRNAALEHERKAARLEAEGRYRDAADEREAAVKQYRKAARRSEYDRYYW